MPTSIIPGTGVIISVEYAPDGLAWARVYDNLVLGWYVDTEIPAVTEQLAGDARKPALAPGVPPHPVILGHLLALPPPTVPIESPQWVKYTEPNVFVPDIWRGTVPEFFTWLATNNGAHRLLGSRLLTDASLQMAFSKWAEDNRDLSFIGDPPL